MGLEVGFIYGVAIGAVEVGCQCQAGKAANTFRGVGVAVTLPNCSSTRYPVVHVVAVCVRVYLGRATRRIYTHFYFTWCVYKTVRENDQPPCGSQSSRVASWGEKKILVKFG